MKDLKFKRFPINTILRQTLLPLFVICFYGLVFKDWANLGSLYANDFLAFWSTGKLAAESGFSQIYNLTLLKDLQVRTLIEIGLLQPTNQSTFQVFPFAVLPFFVFPFTVFKNIDLKAGFWVFTAVNLLLYSAYVIFFCEKLKRITSLEKLPDKNIVFFLSFFPVFDCLINGQIDIFLLICVGEWIRNSLTDRSFLGGMWLAGLLLKPQTLILILPVLLLTKQRRNLAGFISASLVIGVISLFLSGCKGILDLVHLWTEYVSGIASSCPTGMINWRMLALAINEESASVWLGWMIAGIGAAITLFLVWKMIKIFSKFDQEKFQIAILGVFSATLALTWHSHYHMATILVPLIILIAQTKIFPKWIIKFWGLSTPILWIVLGLANFASQKFWKITLPIDQGSMITLSGFLINLILFTICVQKCSDNSYPVF